MNLLRLVFLVYILGFNIANARPKCIPTTYIIPMLIETSIDSDYTQFRSFLKNCTANLWKQREKSKIGFLSLEKQRFYKCSSWSSDDCSKELTGGSVDNKALTIKPHKTYDIDNFIMDTLSENRYCLKDANLRIITNVRCQKLSHYPALNSLLHEKFEEFNNFIKYRKLETTLFWYDFDYISPVDNVGCGELYLLKKKIGSMLNVVYSNKDNSVMGDLVHQCGN